ncbi:MAG TPA: hypothetical protein VFB99_16385 [Vicinamibacterales bacterium]|nr:hypothetical protein [Vicinamibacterales bacterium]
MVALLSSLLLLLTTSLFRLALIFGPSLLLQLPQRFGFGSPS